MNIIQCKMCKKPFHSIGGLNCPECLRKIDLDFITVRDFIYDNQGADIDTVSEETGVEKAVITHLLKEGRLTLASAGTGGTYLMCRVCRKPIFSGSMCEVCKNKIAATMQKNMDSNNPKPKESKKYDPATSKYKMHTKHD